MSGRSALSASQKRRLLSAALTGVLVSTLLSTPVLADKPKPVKLQGQVEKLDHDGGEVRPAKPASLARSEVKVTPPVWPAAGTADVDLTTGSSEKKAGSLPVIVGRGKDASPSKIRVQLLNRAEVPAMWRSGLVTRVSTPTGTAPGAVPIAVDYSAFKTAYGADWSSRLRLWQLPDCALSTPDLAGCSATALASKIDTGAQTVAAQAKVTSSAGTLVALAAASSGLSGDYTATSLAASSTWSTGGSTGGFNWSYPMRVPPGIGAGPVPKVELSYSSASVDGRSSATNNQPSWVGEGFEYSPGYIERSYVPCADDKTGSPNNPTNTGDLCWRSDNATMSLNGGGGELVYDAAMGWHGRAEDGSKIEKLIGGSNGDNDGEYWKVTTTNGTQYFFGLNNLPGQSNTTDSAWTAPVYGNHTGEPCHATAFTDSDCTQAWRWNLDYVVDVHGNTMSYWYGKEANNYGAEATATKKTSYVRGGYLKRADYGTWDRGTADRNISPQAQVVFDPDDRCLADCGTHDASHWPDTPWDQECASAAADCGTKYSPTFWTTKRLAKVTTRVWDTTKATPAWQDVDSYTLTSSFPATGDGSVSRGLWLASIVHSGLVGSAVTMPSVTFDPVSMPNRVLSKTNTTNNWQRLAAVHSETGAITQVVYSLPECNSSNLPSSLENNTKLCYPVIGPDPYSTSGGDLTEYWHKYVVRQITETDLQLADGHQSPTKNTYYTYGGTPAWHYADDNGLTKANYKTWNQFRGYATVDTQVGDSAKSLTRTTFLRGMNGDRAAPSGGTRSVTVAASLGTETVNDEDQFSGMIREQVTYNGTDDRPVAKTVNVPWRSPPTASRTINGDTVESRFVQTRTTYSGTALGTDGSGGWRVTSGVSDFDDTYGTVVRSQSNGDVSKTGDEKCTTYTYNRNTAKNLTTLPRRVTSTATTCGTTLTSPDQVLTDAQTYYDGATSPATAPTRGLITRADAMQDWTSANGTTWLTTGTTSYDDFGRSIKSTDVKGNWATVDYSPAKALVTLETSTNNLTWATKTAKNPYWGLPTTVTDPNSRVTDTTYDALGRVFQVWETGYTKAANPAKPSSRLTYVYSPNKTVFPYTKTEKLNAVGTYDVTYQILDGFLRPRQTQTAILGSNERIVTDTLYDTHGRPELTFRAHAEPGAPSGSMWWEPEWSVPSQTRNVYDQANRVVASISQSGDGVTNIVERWRTSTTYAGDRTTVVPPQGGTVQTTITDAQDRTVELRQYTTASGASGAYQATKYTYNSKDQLAQVTDTAGDKWLYGYDVQGRRTSATDPDRGKTTTAYNVYGEQTSTTDALAQTTSFEYDTLGRKTAIYNGTISAANKRAEWIYDKLYTNVPIKGQLGQSIRYDAAGNAYKTQVRGYNQRYQPTGTQYVVPANETGLAGTYVYGYSYADSNGAPTTVSYPAGGGLADEGVTTVYDAASGLPSKLNTLWSGVDTYVAGQAYSSYGEPTVTTLKMTGGVYAQQSLTYDNYNRRLDTSTVKPETTGTVSQIKYQYDNAGNILGIADSPTVGTADYQCFKNDALGRLTTAWTPSTNVDCSTATPTVATLGGSAPYWADWTLDAVGNRTKQVNHAAAGDTVRDYQVPAAGAGVVRPHTVNAMTTTLPGMSSGTTVSYGYDAIGQMTSRPGNNQTLTWDFEGHLAKVVQGSATIEENVYDADGTRIIRRDAGGATLYLPGMEIRRNVSGTSTTFVGTRYYGFAGQTIASRTAATQSLTWLFNDHQGTQQVAVNAYTQQATVRRQDPYGNPRGTPATWPNNKGFVGGDQDPSGLTHMGAREYDPVLGRFITVDPLQDLSDPQQWNAYAYANNSPIDSSDPSGMIPLIGEGGSDEGQLVEDEGGWQKKDNGKWGISGKSGKSTGKSSTNGGANNTAGSGLSDEEIKKAQAIKKQNALDVILKEGGKILLDFFGVTDIVNCATKGDIKACVMTLINFIPWAKGLKAIKEIPLVVRAGKAVMRWMDDLKWADDVLSKAESCLTHSFAPSTRVLMDHGKTKQIKDIKIGDLVKATDPKTGETYLRRVTVTYSNQDVDLTDLTIRGPTGDKVIHTTQHHPFWDTATKSWIGAGDLTAGKSSLKSVDRAAELVVAVRNYTGNQNMRDLTVARTHTYYVMAGATPVLVHNCGGSGPAAGVLEVSDEVKSIKAFQNYSPSGRGGIEYVFDPVNGRLLVGAPKPHLGISGSPHEQLARSGGLDEGQVLGGVFRRDGSGRMDFDENSGHYGDRWTRETRQQFSDLLGRHGIDSTYTPWGG